jgi:hypothetical protein
MRATQHAPRDPFRVSERLHGLEAISKGRKPRRETLDTLEDVYTRSKRVFGPTHPFTQNARGKILDLS